MAGQSKPPYCSSGHGVAPATCLPRPPHGGPSPALSVFPPPSQGSLRSCPKPSSGFHYPQMNPKSSEPHSSAGGPLVAPGTLPPCPAPAALAWRCISATDSHCDPRALGLTLPSPDVPSENHTAHTFDQTWPPRRLPTLEFSASLNHTPRYLFV